MISGTLVKLLYLGGAIGISVLACVEMMQGRVGEALLCFFGGNFFWRLGCESMILLFSMHELLASVEKVNKSGRN